MRKVVTLIMIVFCIVSFAIVNADAKGKPDNPGGGPKESTCEVYGDIDSHVRVPYATEGVTLDYGAAFGDYEGLQTGQIRQPGTRDDGTVFKHYDDYKVLRIAGGEQIGKKKDKLRVYRGPWTILDRNTGRTLASGDEVEVYCKEYSEAAAKPIPVAQPCTWGQIKSLFK